MGTPSLQHEIKKRRAFESAAEEAYLNVLRTAAVLEAPFDRLFRAHGLSEATYNVLRILRGEKMSGNREGLACQEIGARVITRVPDMTRLLDRLEEAGLVARERSSEDRRVVLCRVTEAGLKRIATLDEPLKELHQAQLKRMSGADLKRLSELLTAARAAASEFESRGMNRSEDDPV